MNLRHVRGFTMVELTIVLIILGTIFAFALPGYGRYMATQNLVGSTENIAAQLRLMRAKAIATGTTQTMHLYYNTLNYDYHIHNGSVVGPGWLLPKGITYYTGTLDCVMNPDGRCTTPEMIVLQNTRGKRDTVSVLGSGLILHL